MKSNLNRVMNWIARIASLASIGLLAAFVVGSIRNDNMPTPNEWVGLVFFPIGVIAGLIVGWRFPLLGGLLALSSLAAFYFWHYLSRSAMPGGPYFLLFTSPAFLFLLAYTCGARQNDDCLAPPERSP